MNTKPENISCRPGTTEAMERLAAENDQLRIERDQAAEAVQKLTEGAPFGEIVGMHTIANMDKDIQRLEAENEALRATKDEAVALVYEGNEIIKEAMEEIQRLNGELGKAKAAGAREALQRAMEEKGFSKAYVSVNTLQTVIADMEAGDAD